MRPTALVLIRQAHPRPETRTNTRATLKDQLLFPFYL
jgi:hypothetical protein